MLASIKSSLEQFNHQRRRRSFRLRFERALRSRAAHHATPHDLFRSFDDESWLWANTAGRGECLELGRVLPAMPDEATQFRFTGFKGGETLERAFGVYALFKEITRKHYGGIGECDNVLDFGCGWGRIIRFFLKDVEPHRLWGVDCISSVIEVCKETNGWCNFRLVAPWPPTSFPDRMFDLIYCYSVFSHLSEEMHLRWLEEFGRILKPGGLLIATTRGRETIEFCRELRKGGQLEDSHLQGLAAAFRETDEWLSNYDKGQYCFSPLGGGDTLDSSFYGETCIPKAYVLSRWAESFNFLDYLDDHQFCEQNVIVVRNQGGERGARAAG